MKLRNQGSEIFIPDYKPVDEAIARTTCMAIAAHQDDIEIMAYDGIMKCFGKEDQWFFAVVVTNGAGSPRDDLYLNCTDEDMQAIRKLEQKKAAFVGEYGALAMMDYTSAEVKDPQDSNCIEEITRLITTARPEIIYTHNPADQHDTHVGVALKVIKALRAVPKEYRPLKLFGCEVWRNLDWLNAEDKVVFDVSGHPNIAAALLEVFDSQICGGKRYDLATMGRRLANATYSEAHGVDQSSNCIYGMDLTPLINDINMDINRYVQMYIERFSQDVGRRITKLL